MERTLSGALFFAACVSRHGVCNPHSAFCRDTFGGQAPYGAIAYAPTPSAGLHPATPLPYPIHQLEYAMKRLITLCLLTISLFPAAGYAQIPEIRHVDANSPIMTVDALKSLQKTLSASVFLVYVRQKRPNNATADVTLDGAAVAISSEDVAEIMPKDDELEETLVEQPKTGTGFFSSTYQSASSPFHKPQPPQKVMTSKRQYFLTTADWLTMGKTFEIEIQHQRVAARLDYRDDAQNVALLSIPRMAGITNAPLFPESEQLPGLVYIVLSPGTLYESMTQHSLSVTQDNRYGTANLQARNGYPLFDVSGRLVGLAVGPEPAFRHTRVVHAKLLDMALHPAKYNNDKVEEIQTVPYDSKQ